MKEQTDKPKPKATVRIGKRRWYDLGSDINWVDHGGVWGKPAGTDDPGMWYVMIFHPNSAEFNAELDLYEVRVTEPKVIKLLEGIGLDEEDYHPFAWQMMTAGNAAQSGYGRCEALSVRQDTKITDRICYKMRLVGSQYMLGEFIGEHPFNFAPLGW